MTKLKRTALSLLTGLVMVTSALAFADARAADKGDIFIEVQAGPRFDGTVESFAGLSTGYCFWNSFSLGVAFDQFYSLRPRAAGTSGLSPAFDVHWFFEPFEISGQVGGFFRDKNGAADRVSLAGSLIYLFAITPAMSLKAEVRARYLWDEDTKLFWALGGRILF